MSAINYIRCKKIVFNWHVAKEQLGDILVQREEFGVYEVGKGGVKEIQHNGTRGESTVFCESGDMIIVSNLNRVIFERYNP